MSCDPLRKKVLMSWACITILIFLLGYGIVPYFPHIYFTYVIPVYLVFSVFVGAGFALPYKSKKYMEAK